MAWIHAWNFHSNNNFLHPPTAICCCSLSKNSTIVTRYLHVKITALLRRPLSHAHERSDKLAVLSSMTAYIHTQTRSTRSQTQESISKPKYRFRKKIPPPLQRVVVAVVAAAAAVVVVVVVLSGSSSSSSRSSRRLSSAKMLLSTRGGCINTNQRAIHWLIILLTKIKNWLCRQRENCLTVTGHGHWLCRQRENCLTVTGHGHGHGYVDDFQNLV